MNVVNQGLSVVNVALNLAEACLALNNQPDGNNTAEKTNVVFQGVVTGVEFAQLFTGNNEQTKKRLQQIGIAMQGVSFPLQLCLDDKNNTMRTEAAFWHFIRSIVDYSETNGHIQKQKPEPTLEREETAPVETGDCKVEKNSPSNEGWKFLLNVLEYAYWGSSYNQSRTQATQSQLPAAVPASRVSVNANPGDSHHDTLDLTKFKCIPVELHDDKVLSLNICPINRTPILHPCRLKGEPHNIYEREALEKYIHASKKSPITRNPKTVGDIEGCKDIEEQISKRLKKYNEAFQKIIAKTSY